MLKANHSGAVNVWVADTIGTLFGFKYTFAVSNDHNSQGTYWLTICFARIPNNVTMNIGGLESFPASDVLCFKTIQMTNYQSYKKEHCTTVSSNVLTFKRCMKFKPEDRLIVFCKSNLTPDSASISFFGDVQFYVKG